ncbi:fucosyltransferase [Klebsormidium nitens]|uniref:Fucosyltransferase n=1 Tax=Klebsormidium nitens TaxID=105231 RepID=A0A1Y1I7M1_KLENI|nr:fucosyltransferase [Klebsormidium nitens]|eukprot:GAQ85141.1 fucosyltransferase [Klebsormidium nitens]
MRPQNPWGDSRRLLSWGRSVALGVLLLIICAFFVDSYVNRDSGRLLFPLRASTLDSTSLSPSSNEHNLIKPNVQIVDRNHPPEGVTCEDWLSKADSAASGPGGREFEIDPVRILEVGFKPWDLAPEEVLSRCDVKCRQITLGSPEAANYSSWDAHTLEWPPSKPIFIPSTTSNSSQDLGPLVVRNIESPHYYPALQLPMIGVNITMLGSLSSHVPQPGCPPEDDYFEPPLDFGEKIPAVMSMISNCNAISFRNEALEEMRRLGLAVHQYGECGRTNSWEDETTERRSPKTIKYALARKHMFYAAFENSIYEDYVTEKMFDALVAGSVPIYIGAPNVMDFVPDRNAIIQLRSMDEVPAVVDEIKRLMRNRTAYEEKLAWKRRLPSSAFRALLNSQAVSQTCKLCIEIATRIQENGLAAAKPNRPCSCTPVPLNGSQVLSRSVHHLYVRERGTFPFCDVFIRDDDVRISVVHEAIAYAFQRAGYVPTWRKYGYQKYQKYQKYGDGLYKVFKVTPVRTTYREAVFGRAYFEDDKSLRQYLKDNPCPRLEVIFI